MTIETISQDYPKLFKHLPEDISALRYLVVIDENYNDDDTDEFDAIDPEDYNYLVYVTELLQEILGEEKMLQFVKNIEAHKDVEEFYLSDVDLYGLQTKLDDEGIAQMILTLTEDLMA